jgi:hypothetical protein
VAAAVGSLGGDGGSPMGEAGVHDFYVTLLEHAQVSVDCAGEDDPCPDPEKSVAEAEALPSPPAKTLDFASFVRLMTSKAVTEYKTPEKELMPAFEALDIDGDGVITREEMIKTMEVVGSNLPSTDGGESWAQKAEMAFDAMDRDKSGTLDCAFRGRIERTRARRACPFPPCALTAHVHVLSLPWLAQMRSLWPCSRACALRPPRLSSCERLKSEVEGTSTQGSSQGVRERGVRRPRSDCMHGDKAERRVSGKGKILLWELGLAVLRAFSRLFISAFHATQNLFTAIYSRESMGIWSYAVGADD